jgi:dipeptidyl-peptidase-4
MKKIISLSTILCALVVSAIAQNGQNGLPRFIRWIDNSQLVVNTKRGDDAAPKNYIYNVVSKQYSVAPADAVPTEKTIVVKKGDLFLKENGSEVQLTFDNAEEKNPTLSPDGNYVGYTIYTHCPWPQKKNWLLRMMVQLVF